MEKLLKTFRNPNGKQAFLRGFLLPFNVPSGLELSNRKFADFADDARVLRSDWETVGNDMRYAFERFKNVEKTPKA